MHSRPHTRHINRGLLRSQISSALESTDCKTLKVTKSHHAKRVQCKRITSWNGDKRLTCAKVEFDITVHVGYHKKSGSG